MKQWIKLTASAIGLTTMMLMPAQAGMDSDERNPGNDKEKVTVIEQKTTEFGTAMKGWALAFGGDLEKSAQATQTSFLKDIERLKNSNFVQDTIEYQKKSWAQGQEKFARNKEQIQQLPSKIKESTTDLFATIAKGLDAVLGGGNNAGKSKK
jgi:tRNA U34 5-carboxymethylaminomethyl modifying GTPase MnmE/TrmE